MAHEGVDPPEHVVVCISLGHQLGEFCLGSSQVAPHHLFPSGPHAALMRDERVADRIGEVASFFTGHPHRPRITRDERRVRLQGEDLAQPQLIADCAGNVHRLGQERPSFLGGPSGDTATGGHRPGQQGGVTDFAAMASACSA